MEAGFSTLQEFFTFTKGMTYILIILMLIGIGAFWTFLNGRDED